MNKVLSFTSKLKDKPKEPPKPRVDDKDKKSKLEKDKQVAKPVVKAKIEDKKNEKPVTSPVRGRASVSSVPPPITRARPSLSSIPTLPERERSFSSLTPEKSKLDAEKAKALEAEKLKAEAEKLKAIEADKGKIEAEKAKIEAEKAKIEAEKAKIEAEKAIIETEKSMKSEDPKSSIEKDLEKRKRVVEELLTTERTYMTCLDLARRYFLIPLAPAGSSLASSPIPVLRAQQTSDLTKPVEGVPRHRRDASIAGVGPVHISGSNSIITEEEHQLIFDFAPILRTNEEFLREIEARFESWSDETLIGDLLWKYAPHFNVYKTYATNYGARNAKLSDLMKNNSRFQQFCVRQQEQPEVRGQDLHSLLITPIQRVPRYELIIQQLLKYTATTHPDYTHLQQALTAIKKVAESINEEIRRTSQRDQVLAVQTRFKDSISLVTPSRYLVRKGQLKEETSEYEIFLFNDLLLQASKEYFGDSLKKVREIPINEFFHAVDIKEEEGKTPLAFEVYFIKDDNFVTFQAKDSTEKQDWLKDMQACSRLYFEKRSTMSKSANQDETCFFCGSTVKSGVCLDCSSQSIRRRASLTLTAPSSARKASVGDSKDPLPGSSSMSELGREKVAGSLKEGFLTKLGGSFPYRWQVRYVVLVQKPTALLQYYEHIDALEPKGSVTLSSETHVKCTNDKPSNGYHYSFTINGNKEDSKTYTFAAKTAESRRSWMEMLKQATNSDKIEMQDTLEIKIEKDSREEFGASLDQSKVLSPLSSLSGGVASPLLGSPTPQSPRSTTEDELLKSKKANEALEAELKQLRASTSKQIETLKKELETTKTEKNEQMAHKKLIDNEIISQKKFIADLQTEIEKLKSQTTKISPEVTTLQRLEKENSTLKQALQDLTTENQTLQTHKADVTLQQIIQDLQKENAGLSKELSASTTEIKDLQTKLSEAHKNAQELEKKVQEIEIEKQALKTELAAAQAISSAQSAQLEKLPTESDTVSSPPIDSTSPTQSDSKEVTLDTDPETLKSESPYTPASPTSESIASSPRRERYPKTHHASVPNFPITSTAPPVRTQKPTLSRRETYPRVRTGGGDEDEDTLEKKIRNLHSQLNSQSVSMEAELDEAFHFLSPAPDKRRSVSVVSPPETSKAPQPSPKKAKGDAAKWKSWGVDEVVGWLREHGLTRFIETFQDCEVQGEDLELIGDQELVDDFEIENEEDRKLILMRIKDLIQS